VPAGSRHRAFRRLVLKANAKHGGGDRCHGCGRPLWSPEETIVGHDAAGRCLVVARCCKSKIAVVLGIGWYIAVRDAPADWLAAVPARGSA
jgi:hypothetical protein